MTAPATSMPGPSAAGPIDFGSNAAMAERLGAGDLADDLDLLASMAPAEASSHGFSDPGSVSLVTVASAVLHVQAGQLRLATAVAEAQPAEGREIRQGALASALSPLLQVTAEADVAPTAAVQAAELHTRVSDALFGA